MASPLPGLTELGCSYDVILGAYADPSACSNRLFDFSKVPKTKVAFDKHEYEYPNIVDVHVIGKSSQEFTYGQTITDSLKDLSNKTKIAGGYAGFSGSVEVDYGFQESSNKNFSFARYQYSAAKYEIELPILDELKKYIRPEIAKVIAEGTPQTVFDKLHTHFLRGFIVGARCVMSVIADSSFYSTKSQLGAAVSASYSGVASVSASNTTNYGSAYSDLAKHASIKFTATGGGNVAFFDPQEYGSDMKKWMDTVADNIVMIDFKNDSLLPIWLLAATPARAKELEDAYPAYFQSQQKKFDPIDGPLLYAKFVPCSQTLFYTNDLNVKSYEVCVCRPRLDPGWYYLGQAIMPGKRYNGYEKSLIVKEIVPGTALSTDLKWEKVWDDAGSGSSYNFSVYQGFSAAPMTFKVLGSLFKKTLEKEGLQPEDTAGLCAVRASLLGPGRITNAMWTDAGSGAKKSVSLYHIWSSNVKNIKECGGFYAHPDSESHRPVNPEIYGVKWSALKCL